MISPSVPFFRSFGFLAGFPQTESEFIDGGRIHRVLHIHIVRGEGNKQYNPVVVLGAGIDVGYSRNWSAVPGIEHVEGEMPVCHALDTFEKRNFGNGERQVRVGNRNRKRRRSDDPAVMIGGKHAAERLDHDLGEFLFGDNHAPGL